MSGIYLILQNPKPQVISPKSQVPRAFEIWDLGLGIWDLEFYR